MAKSKPIKIVPDIRFRKGKPTLKSLKNHYLAKLQIIALSKRKVVSRESFEVMDDFVNTLKKEGYSCACKCNNGKRRKR